MRIITSSCLVLVATSVACGGEDDANLNSSLPPTDTAAATYGSSHSGQYHLGPVDFAESDWHNACAPGDGYVAPLQGVTGLGGEYLAGVSNTYAQSGGICDACILITTAAGRSIVARVVTYGATNEPGDLDVSPSVYTALNQGEYPRTMTWQLAKCPDNDTLRYEFQSEANIWWTSLWVRNPRVPLERVEVQSSRHATPVALRRASDGTLNDDSGFGSGAFTLRLYGVDGQMLTDTFSSFSPSQIITSSQQFD